MVSVPGLSICLSIKFVWVDWMISPIYLCISRTCDHYFQFFLNLVNYFLFQICIFWLSIKFTWVDWLIFTLLFGSWLFHFQEPCIKTRSWQRRKGQRFPVSSVLFSARLFSFSNVVSILSGLCMMIGTPNCKMGLTEFIAFCDGVSSWNNPDPHLKNMFQQVQKLSRKHSFCEVNGIQYYPFI